MDKVIFRKFSDGQVIAIFPEIDWNNCGHVTSYMHIGQHSGCDLTILNIAPKASEDEYASLKTELECIGYSLSVSCEVPVLYLVRGLPGSGKSTFAKHIASQENLCHFESDQFFCLPEHNHPMEGITRPMPQHQYTFDRNRLQDAHDWCRTKTDLALSLGKSVIVSNTFVQCWELEPYFDLADMHRIKCHVLTCTGDYGNVHGIPEIILHGMRDRYEQ